MRAVDKFFVLDPVLYHLLLDREFIGIWYFAAIFRTFIKYRETLEQQITPNNCEKNRVHASTFQRRESETEMGNNAWGDVSIRGGQKVG